MAFALRPTEQIVADAKELLRLFRFSFEKAEITLEYFPLEHRYGLAAKGSVFTLKIKMNADWNDNLKYQNRRGFYQRLGLIPVWSDPVC